MALIACGDAFFNILHHSLSLYIFRDDLPNVILQKDVLDILCCETKAQKFELRERWEKDQSRYSIPSRIEELRQIPLRLHVQPLMSRQQICGWAHSPDSVVDITTMSQMRTISTFLVAKVFEGDESLTPDKWAMLFEHDDEAAEDAFEVFFGRHEIADEDAVTEQEFCLAFYDCFKQRKFIQSRIRNFDNLFNVIRSLLYLVLLMLMSLVVAKIFSISPYSFITVFFTVTAVSAFALPSALHRMILSILFVFATKPVRQLYSHTYCSVQLMTMWNSTKLATGLLLMEMSTSSEQFICSPLISFRLTTSI
jgi:hypothetical protein